MTSSVVSLGLVFKSLSSNITSLKGEYAAATPFNCQPGFGPEKTTFAFGFSLAHFSASTISTPPILSQSCPIRLWYS